MVKQVEIEVVPDGVWAFKLITPAFKAGRKTWFKVSDEMREYALNVLPPIYFAGGFALGEPSDSDERGVATYVVFCRVGENTYARELAKDQFVTEAAVLREALTQFSQVARELRASCVQMPDGSMLNAEELLFRIGDANGAWVPSPEESTVLAPLMMKLYELGFIQPTDGSLKS